MGAVKRVKRLFSKYVKNAIDPTPLLRKFKTRRQIRKAQKASKADPKGETITTVDQDVEWTSEEQKLEQVSFLDIVQNDSFNEDLFVDGILKDEARELVEQEKVYAGVVQARVIDDDEFLKREEKNEAKLKAKSDQDMENARLFIEGYKRDFISTDPHQDSFPSYFPMICIFTVIALLYFLSTAVQETLSTAMDEWLRAALVRGCQMIEFSTTATA